MASRIREVWADNLDAELVALREALDHYPVVSMSVPPLSLPGRASGGPLADALPSPGRYCCCRVHPPPITLWQASRDLLELGRARELGERRPTLSG